MPQIAAVQMAPVLLDRDATLVRAVDAAEAAAAHGAKLVVFPEAFVPGYPLWIWSLRASDDSKLVREIHERLAASAVDLAKDHLAPLRAAARRLAIDIVCGIDEIELGAGGTIYNTVVTISADGDLANVHRKLMPTNPERMVWGFGDASGLRPVITSCGRTGALLCWENYMPLARYAMYSQGVELYLAPTWDHGDAWIATMRHIAKEGRCWVAGNSIAMKGGDVPDDFPGKATLFPDPKAWLNDGDSVVVDPMGNIVAGPMHREQGILYAEIEPAQAITARRTFDVVGHYARPDIFTLHVNQRVMRPALFDSGAHSGDHNSQEEPWLK